MFVCNKMNNRVQLFAISFVIISALVLLAVGDRQGAGRRVQSSSRGFSSPCGTSEEVAGRIGRCLDPIFTLVEGKFDELKGDADILHHCKSINETDKCVRQVSKDCLTGLHKTAAGSVASALKRFKGSECKNEQSRSRYIEPFNCARVTGKACGTIFREFTAMEQAIRDLPIEPEEKLVKTCCLLTSLDKELENVFNKACPQHTAILINIVHAITDDARNALCLSKKCPSDSKMKQRTLKQNQNFIEPTMQVVFTLSTD